jgi:hypothetical protein
MSESTPDLSFARDETATTDPASILPGRTERYLVRRWPLDEHREVVEVTEVEQP